MFDRYHGRGDASRSQVRAQTLGACGITASHDKRVTAELTRNSSDFRERACAEDDSCSRGEFETQGVTF
jgi:hypothetical protein